MTNPLESIRVSRKLLLIALMFIAPMGCMLYFMTDNINRSHIAAAEKELAGNEFQRPLEDAAKGTTAGATQTAASASELARLATDLRGVVEVFKQQDSPGAAVPPAASRQPGGTTLPRV